MAASKWDQKVRDAKLKRRARRMGWESVRFQKGRYFHTPYILVDADGNARGPMAIEEAEQIIESLYTK